MLFNLPRITVITGHYGTGKSEFAVNLALGLSKSGCTNIMLADLDVVNPYFRSRESVDILNAKGIKVISSGEAFPGVDLPYMPRTISTILDDPSITGIIDAGGDPAGARVLNRYAQALKEAGAAVVFVVNGNRPATKTPEETITFLRRIEDASDLEVTALVNNTHLLSATALEDIVKGARLTQEVSSKTGIPILCHGVSEGLIHALINSPEGREVLSIAPAFPMELNLKKPWEI